MKWLRPWRTPVAQMSPIAPDKGFYAIGDLHGCLPLLERLAGMLDNDLPIVCVGDYVDRGDDSAGVIRWLMARPAITCLKGNHEAMMLDFIADPAAHGARWLRYGGLQTLASFGIGGIAERAEAAVMIKTRDRLVAAMGADMLAWLEGLQVVYLDGNVAVVHAGADPVLPLTMQSEETLVWGHPAFEKTQRTDGNWVVHGHTITPEPAKNPGRIAIDTGAYATGHLTAVRVSADGSVKFIQT